jgi:nucleoid DNA-binding protein|tara:strand:+ start:7738 stop:8100 length:363 start_codon:yes stop_codon:yes gene_type:complete
VNPKKHKEFKKGIAEEVSVHPQVVDDFIAFYYSKLRKKLSQLDYPRINVDGLGTFYLRKNKVEAGIKKNKSMLGNIAKRTYNGYAKSENIIKNIELMSAALDQMEKDILKKKDFKNKKND